MLRYTLNRKRHEMTIEKQQHLSLAEARTQAEQIRIKIRQKEDPISERKKQGGMVINTINDFFRLA